MLKREQGLALDEPGGDVWSREKNRDGDVSYIYQPNELEMCRSNFRLATSTMSQENLEQLNPPTFELVFLPIVWVLESP